MVDSFKADLGLDVVLNARFRGHVDRDWQQWREHHFWPGAAEIPPNADRAWIGREKMNYRGIGDRRNLRHVIAANADQPFLDEIGELLELERLELEWPMTAHDLSPLLRLTHLRHLSIDSPRKIADFRPLLEMPALRTLLITNAKHMTDLLWLKGADHLEVIGVEGGMWSPMKIPSLEPLAGLKSLRAFLGASTRLGDKKLMPLADCPRLEYLGIAAVAPREEFERLHRARPDLICSWFRPESWVLISRPRRKGG